MLDRVFVDHTNEVFFFSDAGWRLVLAVFIVSYPVILHYLICTYVHMICAIVSNILVLTVYAFM